MTASYVAALVKAYPAIKEVWLIGSRANDEAKATSDWDYIAVADRGTLDALSRSTIFRDPAVDLLVVYDGNYFCKPWRDGDQEKKGSFVGWKWQRLTDTEASYKATKPYEDAFCVTTATAKRMFP